MFYLYVIGYDDDSSEHKMPQPSKQKQGRAKEVKLKGKKRSRIWSLIGGGQLSSV